MSHALTPYYKQIIRRQIATGRFNNESEVIRAIDELVALGNEVAGATLERLPFPPAEGTKSFV